MNEKWKNTKTRRATTSFLYKTAVSVLSAGGGYTFTRPTHRAAVAPGGREPRRRSRARTWRALLRDQSESQPPALHIKSPKRDQPRTLTQRAGRTTFFGRATHRISLVVDTTVRMLHARFQARVTGRHRSPSFRPARAHRAAPGHIMYAPRDAASGTHSAVGGGALLPLCK